MMIWRCPRCRSDLIARPGNLRCSAGNHEFEVVGGIPDLRVDVDSWVDYESDLAFARELATKDQSLEEMIRAVFAARPNWDPARVARRTREVLDGPRQMREQVEGWLDGATAHGPILDLGCGTGPMIVALLSAGRECIGVDVSMTWLFVAQRMIRDAGHTPILAAAVAEALPLADSALGAVVSLDVIEHVRDVPAYVREIDRTVRLGGSVAISTPNRFSLSAEPHVFVWGVGWIPRRWQKQFVYWRSGKSYDDTILLSHAELTALMKRNSDFSVTIRTPPIQVDHIRNFARPKAFAANIYNRLVGLRALQPLFSIIGPFYQMVGIKKHQANPNAAQETI